MARFMIVERPVSIREQEDRGSLFLTLPIPDLVLAIKLDDDVAFLLHEFDSAIIEVRPRCVTTTRACPDEISVIDTPNTTARRQILPRPRKLQSKIHFRLAIRPFHARDSKTSSIEICAEACLRAHPGCESHR